MPTFYVFLFWFVLLLVGQALFIVVCLLWLDSEERELRLPRTILCPENKAYATVGVDSVHAARTMLQGKEEYRIVACSRWPERQTCDQGCALQVPLVADSRTECEYAPFGMSPAQLRINNPVRITPAMLARMR